MRSSLTYILSALLTIAVCVLAQNNRYVDNVVSQSSTTDFTSDCQKSNTVVQPCPIIGILSLPNGLPAPFSNHSSYFPSSYVKFLESGGARVVPLPYTTPLDELRTTLGYLNGALFTGGAAEFFNPDGSLTTYARAAEVIYQEVVSADAQGEVWPLWGTCLGHELLLTLASNNNQSVLTNGFDSENVSWPLYPVADTRSTSRLYGSANIPDDIWNYFLTENITMNSHQAGITPVNFQGSSALMKTLKILAIGYDRQGKAFVSSTEGITLPLYTTQYHPEKPLFEWWSTQNVNHSFHSIEANSYLQRFFVNQARMNTRSFPSPSAEMTALIYNYNAVYTAAADPGFEQCYFFD